MVRRETFYLASPESGKDIRTRTRGQLDRWTIGDRLDI